MNRIIAPHSNSKRAIMDRLTSRLVDALPLPTIDGSQLTHYDDPVAKFTEMLAMVGGEAHFIERAEEAKGILDSIPAFAARSESPRWSPKRSRGTWTLRRLTIRTRFLRSIGSSPRVNSWSQRTARFGSTVQRCRIE